MTRRRKRRARGPSRNKKLLVLVTVIFLILIFEGVVIALTFASPKAGKDLGRAARKLAQVFTGSGQTPGVPERIGQAVADGWNELIEPLWAAPAQSKSKSEFGGCASCHPDYATKKRFANVYMDHAVHDQRGVACATCHTATAHPNPAPPEEAVCEKCHSEVKQPKRCDLCHPPGSLPHFYILGASREGLVDCATCHPTTKFGKQAKKPLVNTSRMTSNDKTLCASCHQQADCQQCHSVNHPPDWVKTHGPEAFDDQSCNQCHAIGWCADRCHWSAPPRPLPTRGAQ